MFKGYIRKAVGSSGCRGGIIPREDGSYAIEIGSSCYCEAEPAVVASYSAEILEFLRSSNSPLGKLLLNSIRQGCQEFEQQLRGSDCRGDDEHDS